MNEQKKVKKMYQFLYEKAFKPMLDYANEYDDENIKKVVYETMKKFESKETTKDILVSYSNIISHTSSSTENFYNLSKQKGIQNTLEDIAEDFFKTFNDKWLNS